MLSAKGSKEYGHQQIHSMYDQHSISYHLVCSYLGEELFDPLSRLPGQLVRVLILI